MLNNTSSTNFLLRRKSVPLPPEGKAHLSYRRQFKSMLWAGARKRSRRCDREPVSGVAVAIGVAVATYFFLYADGVIPISEENILIRCDTSTHPTACAISASLIDVSVSIRLAISIL